MSVETKFYLDSSNLEHIQKAVDTGMISGVTTNPSNFALTLVEQGITGLTHNQLECRYLERVRQIHEIVHGPVSAQVPVSKDTSIDDAAEKALSMHSQLLDIAHFMKLPANPTGIAVAYILSQELSSPPLNMTLVFIPKQFLAVYLATLGNPNVVLSPFIRRLYSPPKEANLPSQNGMDLIEHGRKLYSKGDGHVGILAASIGDTSDIKQAQRLGADIVTIPYPVFELWKTEGFQRADENFVYPSRGTPIPFEDFPLKGSYRTVSTNNILTSLGVGAFNNDWEKPLVKF